MLLLARGRMSPRPLARILVCASLAMVALVGLLAGGRAVAAARTSASWQLGSTSASAVTTSTLTVRTSAKLTVVALRLVLPAGSGGRLTVHAASGLGSGRLRSSGSLLTYTLSHATTV